MKQRIKYFLVLVLLISSKVFSQDIPKGLEIMEIYKIAESYRQSTDLSFNMSYTYTDSASQATILEQLRGSYKIHDGKYWSILDSIEYVQGGVFNMAVYHHDSMIVITDRQEYTTVLQLPLMDSIFQEVYISTTTVTKLNDSTLSLKILFNADAPYRSYEVQYDSDSYLISKVKYFVSDADSEIPGASGVACVTMSFSNYSDAVISDDHFKESKFVYRQADKVYVQPAFTGYKIIVSGNSTLTQ